MAIAVRFGQWASKGCVGARARAADKMATQEVRNMLWCGLVPPGVLRLGGAHVIPASPHPSPSIPHYLTHMHRPYLLPPFSLNATSTHPPISPSHSPDKCAHARTMFTHPHALHPCIRSPLLHLCVVGWQGAHLCPARYLLPINTHPQPAAHLPPTA